MQRFEIRLSSLLGGVMLLALLLSPCMARAQEEQGNSLNLKSVIAEGVGADENRAIARDNALSDAQRRAVEQGLGLYIKSETLVKNAQLIDDTIYRESKGYVHSYKILNETAQDGMIRIKINAQVRLGKLEEDIEDLYDRLKIAGNPRILISIAQTPATDIPDLVQNAVMAKLVDLGFKVLDESQLKTQRERDALKMIRNGNEAEATVIPLKDKSDIIIVGTARPRVTKTEFGDGANTVATYNATVQLAGVRAIRTSTAQVIAAKLVKVTSKEAKFSEQDVLENTLELAGETWVDENLGTITRAIVDPAQAYTLLVVTNSQKDLLALYNELNASRLVRQVEQVSFEKGLAETEIIYCGLKSSLLGVLTTIKSLAVDVKGEEGRKIRISITPKK